MRIIIVIFLLVSVRLWGQPGGGGGLRVLNVYDEHKRPVDVEQLKVKLLKLDRVANIVAEEDFYVGRNEEKMIVIPPSNHFSKTQQGLVITYKNKTYRIDFEGVIGTNGAGRVEEIDSLVLFKPYILSKRSYDYQSLGREEFNKYYILREIADKYLSWGVTPETYKHLSVIDLMYDSPKYANNRKPKPWMESFKQLNVDYGDSNTHSKEEYADYLKRIDEMISKYGDLEPFVIFKMRFLYKEAHYKEFISYYEKKSAGYRNFSGRAIQAYCYLKEYDKAIALAKERASEEKRESEEYFGKFVYISYNFDWLFIKSYYKNESIKNELESFVSGIDLDKDDRNHLTILKRFEELKRYDSYREKKKLTDKEKEQKKCMEANLLKVFKEGCILCDDFEDCLKD
ncbi:hypothetical protein CGC50_03085 [Capnocytophaga gingivalis]|uniref:Uncharacterized protein n=1 Tax=Capnocytophaga gingivalis TaxID=1017 RepID=A0A250FQ87_9FLAO|nr:hypothetical protein [Capnocytophaga gingivalis]ATA86228.1 hypothetical protein CGC50_03085 [Capnocytophaga gingivalis]